MADFRDPKHPGRTNEVEKVEDFKRKAPAPVGSAVPDPKRDEENKKHEEELKRLREEEAEQNK